MRGKWLAAVRLPSDDVAALARFRDQRALFLTCMRAQISRQRDDRRLAQRHEGASGANLLQFIALTFNDRMPRGSEMLPDKPNRRFAYHPQMSMLISRA